MPALVDTGCTRTIVSQTIVDGEGRGVEITLMDGRAVRSAGEARVAIEIDREEFLVECVVMSRVVPGFDVILGIDVLKQFKSVTFEGTNVVFEHRNIDSLGAAACALGGANVAEIVLDDVDFEAMFDGRIWTVAWKWADAEAVRGSAQERYAVNEDIRADFEKEIDAWIEQKILVEAKGYDGKYVPLLAVHQKTKSKVRPVLNFREVNRHIQCHTGDAQVCGEILRKWRTMGDSVGTVDLRRAYLQIFVDESLWKYQAVRFRGKSFFLTRLGFGLASAPKIMAAIVEKVLSLSEKIRMNSSFYVDDIIYKSDRVSRNEVVQHLRKYGLEVKDDSGDCDRKMLGLRIGMRGDGTLCWSRGADIENYTVDDDMTKRELYSVCGQLVGHYPVAGWLRVITGLVKRSCDGEGWRSRAGDEAVRMVRDVIDECKRHDPANGVWNVNVDEGVSVWTDASQLALGVTLTVNGNIIEDGTWLRKVDDHAHINVAELDAVIRGLNIAVKWGFTRILVMCDSATVVAWMRSMLTKDRRVRVKGLHEVLVRRRLGIVKEIIDDDCLDIGIELVSSRDNKADNLTRILKSKKWNAIGCAALLPDEIKRVHDVRHMGVDKTMYFATLQGGNVTRKQVERVVRACVQCASIDPHAVRWESGSLEVKRNWYRLATDITHYGSRLYLSVIDCGPSRRAIWREIASENATIIGRIIDEICYEQGPPYELLSDNGLCFKSQALANVCEKWGIVQLFRCAHTPSGNGIVERNHRSIKRWAARTGSSILECVYWYNVAPKVKVRADTVPVSEVYKYEWRVDRVVRAEDSEEARYSVGDKVYVKPADVRCTDRWPLQTVTAVNSSTNVSVNGTPRHVKDLRAKPIDDGAALEGGGDVCSESSDSETETLDYRRPVRTIRLPARLRD